MNPQAIAAILSLLLEAFKALEQSGVLKKNSTFTPGLADAREYLAEEKRGLAEKPQRDGGYNV